MNRQNPSLAVKTFSFLTCVCLITAAAVYAQAGRTFSQRSQPTMLLVTITNSGSTNTLPYTLDVYDDGSVTAAVKGKSQVRFLPGTADAQQLTSLLKAVGDVSVLSGGKCARSVSFGTITQITYKGKISGDIFCTAQTTWPKAGYDLSSLVRQLNSSLHLTTVKGRS